MPIVEFHDGWRNGRAKSCSKFFRIGTCWRKLLRMWFKSKTYLIKVVMLNENFRQLLDVCSGRGSFRCHRSHRNCQSIQLWRFKNRACMTWNSSNTSMTKEEYKKWCSNNKSFLRKAAVKDKMNTETGKKIAQRHQYGRFSSSVLCRMGRGEVS
jgi:hypothetical protein